jgi:hypothetical protein
MNPLARLISLFLLASLSVGVALAAPTPKPSPVFSTLTPFKTITWEALTPKDWDPFKRFRSSNLAMLNDGSPKALQMMDEMRAEWDNAPIVAAMDGTNVKLPGYLVPLDENKGELKEFLLVPYFGACIHTPPPPANQIVHVVVAKPVRGFRTMDAVWVSGMLKTHRQESMMGMSGYRMDGVLVERYVAPNP